MKIMIDFHYRDGWADPGKQTKPVVWLVQDVAALKASIRDHTISVLTALKTNGISPQWVQVGNETNDGMLWPEGKASANMNNFAQLVNAGHDAVKSVSPSSHAVVHLSNGWDNNLFRRLFDGLKANGGKWDITGMSMYPTASNWATLNTQCFNNMNDVVARYGKAVMIVETGMSWDQAAVCNLFLADLIAKTRQ